MSVCPILESSPWMTDNTLFNLKTRKDQTVRHRVTVRMFSWSFCFSYAHTCKCASYWGPLFLQALVPCRKWTWVGKLIQQSRQDPGHEPERGPQSLRGEEETASENREETKNRQNCDWPDVGNVQDDSQACRLSCFGLGGSLLDPLSEQRARSKSPPCSAFLLAHANTSIYHLNFATLKLKWRYKGLRNMSLGRF